VGFAVVRVVVPFYYAFNDSRLPMRASILTVVINLLLYWPLIQILDFAGLAAATSVAGLFNAFVLIAFLSSKGIDTNLSRVLLNLFRITLAAILAIYLAKLMPTGFAGNELTFLNRAMSLGVTFLMAAVAYLAFCIIFHVGEARYFVGIFLNKFKK
jgi:putative peptidoglycan lipid II flippase